MRDFEDTFEGTAVQAATEGTTEGGGLFPSTPPPEKPTPKPQAHRGRIIGVTIGTKEGSDTRWLTFGWRSLDTAQEDTLTVFPPQAYIDNPQVDPAALSEETPINPETGKETMSDRAKYARAVRNSKGDGTIETIVNIAIAQGHVVSLTTVPRTFEQVAEYLNSLTTGTEVIALLRPQGGDGDYADRLRTTRFQDPVRAEDPKFLAGLAKGGYRVLWQ